MYPDEQSVSAALYGRALNSLPGGNSRTAVFREPYPIYMERGAGAWIWDVDGVRRLDAINNQSSLVHGHSHPKIVAAVAEQSARFLSVAAPTLGEIELAEELCRRVAGIERVSFCNSGSEGNLFAIRAARAFTGRDGVAKVEGAYHGNLDAVEISVFPRPDAWGAPSAPVSVPEGLGIPQAALTDTLVLPFNDVEASRDLINEHAARLACVVVDPAPPRMGFREASDAYLAMLREVTLKHGIQLIFDEVYSFRQSHGGAQGRRGVTPDLTSLGKLIGGGLPIGATAGRADVMCVFDPRGGGSRAGHAGTFNANPMSMAAGLAAMELLDEAAFVRLDQLGARARDGLRTLLSDLGIPGIVTGVGSLFSMIIGWDGPVRNVRDLTEAAASPLRDGRTPRALGAEFSRALLNHGVFGAAPSTFVLSTAMSDEEVDFLVAACGEALRDLRPASLF
jgi:glutamate-1-semialdehyde 2,1-aminomutase